MVELVHVPLPGRAYEVRIGAGLLDVAGEAILPILRRPKVFIVSDAHVAGLHLPALLNGLDTAGITAVCLDMPQGEATKSWAHLQQVVEWLLSEKTERGDVVIAFGGGVIGDLVGFAAAIMRRGVRFVQIPTSLLAQVDSSVGGKTGINSPQGKNLIGAFHQPSRVVIDPEVLATLSERELRCGLAECLKHGVIRDPLETPGADLPPLFDWITEHAQAILALDTPTLVELVKRNVEIKASVVMADEKEAGVRAHLNLGHTFAHAIEATSQFGTRYKHGEAVSLGMVAATAFAVNRRLCPPELLDQVMTGCAAVGLPTTAKHLAPDAILLKTMAMDKKVRGGRIRLVLPTRMGEVTIVDDATADEVKAAWAVVRG